MAPLFRVRRTRAFFLAALGTLIAFALFGVERLDAATLEPGGTFTDEDLNTHEGYIEAIAAEGVTSGCGYQLYCPSEDVTRAQMASFIARALDLPASTTNHFTDDDGSTHEANINKLADAGITLGCGGGLYCPGDNVARDQMASFLGRGLGLEPQTPPYPVRALVSRFYQWEPTRDDIRRYEVDDVHYSPRQFAAGFRYTDREGDVITNASTYEGWDVLMPASRWSDRTDSNFFNFFLTRPARVALVWTERWNDRPGWLSNWELSGTVSIDGNLVNVYERSLGYGWQTIPGPAPNSTEGSHTPIVLVAEYTAQPTAAPPVPDGAETPVPNELCPVWVHDSYTTVAWDGESHGTWHPQIDPVYWCYFGHDHGSNPAIIPGAPFVGYQYVADKVPQDEPDMGFKETIFQTPDGYWVRYIDHASTASGRRVCAQFHTLYAMVYSASGTELFRAGFKLDFGVARSTEGEVLNPSNCGYSMPALDDVTDFERKLRINSESHDYEQWRAGPTVEASHLGMVMNHEFDIRDPFTHCNGITCNTVAFHSADRNQTGTQRVADNTFRGNPMVFDARLSLATGTYYTDPYGNGIVDADADNATQQYIAPGLYLNLGSMPGTEHCAAVEPWDMPYVCNDNLSVGKVNISRSLDPAGWMAQLEAASG